ncbi:hypothetical protein F4825DRAFT_102661 [Nemania diffusa]|nr:hypothetical protein F4825DRAFT_102661 [Nemania diffusa]
MQSDFRFIDDRLAKFQLGSFNNPLFLRHNLARTLLTREGVKARLELKGYEADEIEKLVTYVTTEARIVFLTLVYLECLEHIKTLQDGGFTDQDLPVYERDREIDGNKEVFSWNAQRCPVVWSCFASLSARKQQNFCMDQWKFLAPNFKKANFPCQTIKDERPLPLMPAEGAPPTGGHFGMVTKALIPVEHQDYIDLNGRGDYPVAVKILAIREEGIDDHRLDYFFDREAKTLKAMSYLGTPHLIKFLLAFKQGIRGENNTFEVKTRGFLFPWASGGNLSSFWMKESPRGQLDMLKWHLYQLRGLADAIMKLHALHTRHGDIKPANILLFDNLQPGQRTLVIADVGLAKVHEYYTRQRLDPTTTTHASTMQGPPETSDAETKFSRKYDVWSFGCVLFEFLVWAAFPKADYKKFLEVFIKQKPPTQIALWVQTPEGKDLHSEVWKKAEELRDILKQHDSAVPSQLKPVLKQLLELVMTRLLVIDVEKDKRYLKEPRADSKEMSAEMNKICNKRVLGNYTHSAPDLNGLTRTDSSDAAQGLVNLSLSRNETSKLQDQWEDVTDNEVARRIATQLNWAPPASDTEPSLPICDQCNTIDFRSRKIHISCDLDTMRHERCTLCKLLYNTLFRTSVSKRKSFHLFRTGSTLRVSHLQSALTLYSGINLSPYAQVGLPQIPIAGSAQEFALLGEFIRLCNDTHNCTSQQRDGARIYGLPTRLIDVGEGDNARVHLIVKPSTSLVDITSGRYAALSHCWGDFSKNSESCLLKENLQSFQNRIAVEKLPKMFQDAIKATRGLKLRYLWLDSLCIIQDDGGDWASEAKRMEDVYCSAYVTLAASSAKSVYEGFLDRSSRRQWSRVPDTPDGPLYVAEMIDDFQTDVEKAVLSTRAWVLQERALSRRTIHFTSTQVYWECGQGVHCETLAQLRK